MGFMFSIGYSLGNFQVLGYYMPINYKNSTYRQSSIVYGAYAKFSISEKKRLECAIDQSLFKTEDEFYGDFSTTQYDLTGLFTNYFSNYWNSHVGIHYISSSDEISTGTNVILTGINYMNPLQWNSGVTIYYSTYPSQPDGQLTVSQVTQNLGFYIGDRIKSSFYIESRIHYIQLSREISFKKKEFYSLEQLYTYYRNRWSASLSIWTGEQLFAVHNNGFILYNVAEKYTGATSVTFTHDVGEKTSITLGTVYMVFREAETNTKATMNALKLSIGHSF